MPIMVPNSAMSMVCSVGHSAAGNRHALGLASRKRAGALRGEAVKTDIGEMAARRLERAFRQSPERGPQARLPAQGAAGHIGQDAAAADQAGVLPDHCQLEPRPAQLFALERAQIGAAE
jgi:hypothetical protein